MFLGLACMAATVMLLGATVGATSAQPAVTDWPMYQFDLKHTGTSTAAGPGADTEGIQVKWTYKSVSWVKNQVAIGPTAPPPNAGIPAQAVFFGDAKFPLCMVDPDRATADPATWCTDIGGFVNASSPAIGNPIGDVQTIYIGDRNNIFWAIDSKTHRPLWHWKIPLDGDVHASPIINPVDGTVYGSCGCTTTGVLYAWDKIQTPGPDGVAEPRWTVYIRPGIRYSQPAGFFRGPGSPFRIYLGTADGQLAAVDDNGATGGIPGTAGRPSGPNWTVKLKIGNARATKNYHSSPSIGPDGTIYIGTNKGIFAVTDQGDHGEVLSVFTDNALGEWDTAFAIDRVNVGGRARTVLYASLYSANFRTFYAIDISDPAAPQKLFRYGPFRSTSGSGHAITPAPVVDAKSIVYAAIGSTVFAFDPKNTNLANPQPAWTFKLTNRGDAISLAVGDKVLYVAAKDNTLYALQAKP